MGIFEALAIWVGTSVLFSVSIGKLLHALDQRHQQKAEVERQQRSRLLMLHPSALTHR